MLIILDKPQRYAVSYPCETPCQQRIVAEREEAVEPAARFFHNSYHGGNAGEIDKHKDHKGQCRSLVEGGLVGYWRRRFKAFLQQSAVVAFTGVEYTQSGNNNLFSRQTGNQRYGGFPVEAERLNGCLLYTSRCV